MGCSDSVKSMVMEGSKTLPSARAALLQAVARGRTPPPAPIVRPRPCRPASGAWAGLHVEEIRLCSEAEAATAADNGGMAQAWVPVRLAKLPSRTPPPPQQQQQQPGDGGGSTAQQRLPVVLLMHATGVDKDSLAAEQAALARRGYLAVALDCRYHGERATAGAPWRDGYQHALVRAWRGSGERPFLLDNVWDVLRTLDYLETRPDVDAERIGMTGVSLGGMHTWLAAAADARVAAAAPMIGVQYFGWAVRECRYQPRVDSIPLVFQAAAADLALQRHAAAAAAQQPAAGTCGREVTPEVVAAVWDALLPGMLERYDAPCSLAAVAPRPLFIANGEVDPRCPIEGVRLAVEAARTEYERQGAADALQLFVDPGVGHHSTPAMWRQVFAFMDRHLLAEQGSQQA